MTDGIPASRFITVTNAPLSFLGQNSEINTAVKNPSTPPTRTEPSVATIVPIIILNTPYLPFISPVKPSSTLGFHSLPKMNSKKPILRKVGTLLIIRKANIAITATIHKAAVNANNILNDFSFTLFEFISFFMIPVFAITAHR